MGIGQNIKAVWVEEAVIVRSTYKKGGYMDKKEIVQPEGSQLAKTTGKVLIESERAMQEVQAAIIVARQAPRDIDEVMIRIIRACKRPSLAKDAIYMYPRGGSSVEGPSIRLAEVIAQNWGNIDYGERELSRGDGSSEMEAYAWDLETNVRRTKTFNVPHLRFTRAKGTVRLTDPRDIYEMAANMGARRVRACVLSIIPKYVTDEAVEECQKTLASGDGRPLEQRITDMLKKFDEVGVSKDMVEAKLGHKTKAIVDIELVNLGKIYNSIKDGMSKRENWFDIGTVDQSEDSKDLTEKIKAKKKAPAKKAPKKQPEDSMTETEAEMELSRIKKKLIEIKNEDEELWAVGRINARVKETEPQNIEQGQRWLMEIDAYRDIKDDK